MKVTKADGTVTVVEDESYKYPYFTPRKYTEIKQREQVLELITNSLRVYEGQTTKELSESTKIPEHILNRYLITLERDKRLTRRGSKHYVVDVPPLSISACSLNSGGS